MSATYGWDYEGRSQRQTLGRKIWQSLQDKRLAPDSYYHERLRIRLRECLPNRGNDRYNAANKVRKFMAKTGEPRYTIAGGVVECDLRGGQGLFQPEAREHYRHKLSGETFKLPNYLLIKSVAVVTSMSMGLPYFRFLFEHK